MAIENILWSDLVVSPRNVRKVKTGIESLAASIAAEGLIHMPTVQPRGDGKYEVDVGERRRLAIRKLVKDKTWPRDATVPCEVREDGDRTSLSYAENAQRVAMHPADAIRAFAALAAEGHDEAAIAHRYGYDPREVRKMLALASVSPKVINALAADKIDLPTAQAFTLTDDHARQERVLRKARTVHEVRSLLTESKVTTGHRLFRFVGADAYAAAGGTVTRDLFDPEDGGYADDPDLIHQLVEAKLEAAAFEVEAEGWSEVISLDRTYCEDSYRWHRLYPDDADGRFGDTAKAKGIAVLTIDYQGGLTRSFYTKSVQRTAKHSAGTTPGTRPLYDAGLIEDLSRVRTAALQQEVASHHQVAFAVLLDALLPIAIGSGYAPAHALQVKGGGVAAGPVSDVSTGEIAGPFDDVAELIAAMPEAADGRFAWLLGLDTRDVDGLLAACTGALIDATQDKFADPARLASADRIARAVGLNMNAHWQGGIGFYDRLTRKAALAALAEARGKDAADNCAKLKKPELAAACAERIPGTGWLPPMLITPDLPAQRAPVAANDEDDAFALAAE